MQEHSPRAAPFTRGTPRLQPHSYRLPDRRSADRQFWRVQVCATLAPCALGDSDENRRRG
jgi:hypothetical protein